MVSPCQHADALGDDDPTGGGLGPRAMISSLPAGVADAVIRMATGTRVSGRDALTGTLAERGLTAIDQRVAGVAQFVSARRE